MIGKTISHYKILEKIGEGGMGVVYKAEDTKLKRIIALKFLPRELTRDQEARDRFMKEAQAAAALDHPHICTVHEIDEVDGNTFIAMAYIEGQSLKEKIEAGPLKINEAVEVALQVAEGLKEAHDKGITHRDIKPANIMLTEKGQAKIMDFGLAKLEWGADLTKTATILGTIAYMSPEQARGERVDLRTDIWSLGCVLYEMLSGHRPFTSEQDQATIYSILNESPQPLTSLKKELPQELERTVNKCLEKDPDKRYQKAKEIIDDLNSLQIKLKSEKEGKQPTEEKSSIAV
ncbi:MAG: serine/threonine protein kinase, partial [Candidatus Aminicenantes bacterium]